MPGIARSRRQAASWSRARGRRGRPPPRARPAQRQRAAGGEVEGLEPAGATPARRRRRARRAGRSRGQRRPSRRTIRRWIAGGALELDELLADRPGQRLEGLGRRRTRSVRSRPHGAADERVVAEARRRTRAGRRRRRARSACAATPPRRGRPSGPHAPSTTRSRRGLGDPGDDRGRAHVHQALLHAAAPAPRRRRGTPPAGGRPRGADVGADLDHRRMPIYVGPRRRGRRDAATSGERRSRPGGSGGGAAERQAFERRRGATRSAARLTHGSSWPTSSAVGR